MRTPTLLLLAVICFGTPLHANVLPAPLFTDNAVLQRDKPIPVWGTASPGEKVSVSFAGQSASTTADGSGNWRVDLPAQHANATPADLVIKGNNTLTRSNIVVGEVWLASGQSNMAFTLKASRDADKDMAQSDSFPLIRHIQVKRTTEESPSKTLKINGGSWQVASAKTSGNFTAVGYLFAVELYAKLKIPVGIIDSTWGGTPIESWLPPEALAKFPAEAAAAQARWKQAQADFATSTTYHKTELARWTAEKAAAEADGKSYKKREPRDPEINEQRVLPSCLYNGMIHPLTPYALRGILWYQGEANITRASQYHALFSALIPAWRTSFAQGELPFYWVQIANFQNTETPENSAFLREAQTQTLAVPSTGQAVTIDLGDKDNIHPLNKKDVAKRLARLAFARTYGIPTPDSGPVFSKAEPTGTGFRVHFTDTYGGLVAKKTPLTGFELAGADKIFHSADAVIENDTVLVTSSAVPNPVAVRYAWRSAPDAGLFNQEGLPAVPFRSDTW